MAEVVGIAASAITLAALFSSCIECFSYFKAAQNCPSEAESLLVKLDCEKARLLVWANTVGILQTDPQRRHQELADLRKDVLIRRCIDQIIALLTDARKLQDEYGSRTTDQQESQRYLAVLSVNSMEMFQSTKRTFFARAGTRNAMPSLFSRFKWAIRDAAKFRILLLSLRDFVDHLIQLVPVPPETISRIVEEDIVSTINIQSLQLIENGCDEDSYPQWSAKAAETIKDSEMGTVDRRTLMEILKDTEAMQEVKAASQLQRTALEGKIVELFRANEAYGVLAKYSVANLSKTFVVLTEQCLNLEASGANDCAESNIHSAMSRLHNVAAAFASSRTWSLGRRLYKYLDLPYGLDEKLEQHQAMRLEQVKINSEIPDVEKVCRVYVYCGACVCAIRTACLLATDNGLPEYVDVVVRIDDRIPTSCRASSSAIGILESVRNVIEDFEARGHDLSFGRDKIDCPALEQRIYALEQEENGQVQLEVMIQKLVTEEDLVHAEKDLEFAGLILIAETEICSESLNHAPIVSQPRRPRAGEIYKFIQKWTLTNISYDRLFLGRLSRSKAWIDREKARNDPTDSASTGTSIISQSNLTTMSRKRPRSDSATS